MLTKQAMLLGWQCCRMSNWAVTPRVKTVFSCVTSMCLLAAQFSFATLQQCYVLTLASDGANTDDAVWERDEPALAAILPRYEIKLSYQGEVRVTSLASGLEGHALEPNRAIRCHTAANHWCNLHCLCIQHCMSSNCLFDVHLSSC
jgi:hypothetical protein